MCVLPNSAVTDYFYDGVNLLYEVTGGTGKNHVWANGTILCTVQNNSYTYYHTDHLGASKLQTDGQGKVVSIDITKPYGPVAREGVMADTFADLTKIDPDKSRFQYDAATGTILPPARGRGLPKQVTDNHEVTVEKTNYERVKNARIIQTSSDQVNTELKVEFDFIGKARLTVKNKAGDIVFQDEYSGTELKTKTIRVEVGYTLNQAYTVILELAARNASTPARSTIFSVSWGEAEADYGFVRSLPQTFNIDVYSVRLTYAGAGVIFYLNTGGKLWQKIEPGQNTLLDQPGRTLTIRAYLTMEAGTNLQSYGLEINPYHDMSFTGKFLEPGIGLVYFGGRWYEPGIGRWVTVDPVGDGENWYGYCSYNPIMSFDRDGYFPCAPLIVAGIIYFIIQNNPEDTPRQIAGNALDAVIFTVGAGYGGGAVVLSAVRIGLAKFAGALARQYVGTGNVNYNEAYKEGRNTALIYAGIRVFGIAWRWIFRNRPNGVTLDISTEGRTPAEVDALKEYTCRTNRYLAKKGPQTITSTKGALRDAANAANRAERAGALAAGKPYTGQVGHVPDTAITGRAIPPAGFLDMPGVSNQVAGAQLGRMIGKTLIGITLDGKLLK